MEQSTKKIHPTQTVRIPKRILIGLSGEAVRVAIWLFIKSDETKSLTVPLSTRTLAEELKVTRHAVLKALDEISSAGFATITTGNESTTGSTSDPTSESGRKVTKVTLTYIPWHKPTQPRRQPETQPVAKSPLGSPFKGSELLRSHQEITSHKEISTKGLCPLGTLSNSNNHQEKIELGEAPTLTNNLLPNFLTQKFRAAGLEEVNENVWLRPDSLKFLEANYTEAELVEAMEQLTRWSTSTEVSKRGVPYWQSYRRHQSGSGHMQILVEQLKRNRERKGGQHAAV